MEAAVEHRHLDVDNRETGQVTFIERISHPFFDRGDVLSRNYSSYNLVAEFKTAASRQRFDLEPAIAILTTAPRLALVLALRFGTALDGLLVRDFGSP